MNPCIVILAGFTQPDGNVVVVAEIQIGLDDLLGRAVQYLWKVYIKLSSKGAPKMAKLESTARRPG